MRPCVRSTSPGTTGREAGRAAARFRPARGHGSGSLLQALGARPVTIEDLQRTLSSLSHASLATREHVWMILRNALPSLPQPTAIALRDSLQAFHHHQPATVV
jgi:hypothetical protein